MLILLVAIYILIGIGIFIYLADKEFTQGSDDLFRSWPVASVLSAICWPVIIVFFLIRFCHYMRIESKKDSK